MVEFVLAAIFAISISYSVLTVWKKIPLLMQVPQKLIDESFVIRPSYLKLRLEKVRDFFQQKRYQEFYYSFLFKTLHRMRLWLLRLERVIFMALEGLEARNRRWANTEKNYWSGLKQWKKDVRQNGDHIPRAVFNPEAPLDAAKTPDKARAEIIWGDAPEDKTPG